MEDRFDATVLVVEDEGSTREVLELRLRDWGFRVLTAGNVQEGVDRALEGAPDLVLTDVVMPDGSGLDLLRQLRGDDPERPVVLLTAHATVAMAVEAMKEGALDFLTKPINYRNLRKVLNQAFRDREGLERSRRMAETEEGERGFGPFVGRSSTMREIYELIRRLAESDAPVMITGESGTGKEVAARTIHARSARRNAPFVALNAAAIPRDLVESELLGHEKGAFTGADRAREGCFELADGGILFLDEIAEMPTELQPKLLRVLDEARFRRVGGKQEIEVNVRTVSATNQDPREAVREGGLREDLYYRLNVLALHLPPLREREGDIEVLAHHFLEAFAGRHGSEVRAIRDETLELMEQYRWPGNVREFRNVMERAVILARGEWLDPSHLPPYIRDPGREEAGEVEFPPDLTVAELEKRLILQTLDETGNNKAETARRVGLDVKTIRNKLKSYGIDR